MQQIKLFPSSVLEFRPGEDLNSRRAKINIEIDLSTEEDIDPQKVINILQDKIGGERLTKGSFLDIKKVKFKLEPLK